MSIFVAVVGAILAIFIIIVLHEMGHFLVARCFGIKILRFSIGFGKALYKRTGKSGTEYVLAAIPLGGYVKMLGETDAQSLSESEQAAAYHKKPLLVRMAVVLAGPLTNFVLAFLVFWIAFLIGSEHLKPIVGQVTPDSFAAQAGIHPGDEIVQVAGERTLSWQQVMMALVAKTGDKKVTVMVKSKDSSASLARTMNLSQWQINQVKPNIFKDLGMFPDLPKTPPVVKKVVSHSPAAQAGIQPLEEILKFDGKRLTHWRSLVDKIQQQPGKEITLTVKGREGIRTVRVFLGTKERDGAQVGYLGVVAFPAQVPQRLLNIERYNPMTAVVPAVQKTALMVKYNAVF